LRAKKEKEREPAAKNGRRKLRTARERKKKRHGKARVKKGTQSAKREKLRTQSGGGNGTEEQREHREGNTERAKGITEGKVTD
jgi:hypothetical protein